MTYLLFATKDINSNIRPHNLLPSIWLFYNDMSICEQKHKKIENRFHSLSVWFGSLNMIRMKWKYFEENKSVQVPLLSDRFGINIDENIISFYCRCISETEWKWSFLRICFSFTIVWIFSIFGVQWSKVLKHFVITMNHWNSSHRKKPNFFSIQFG